jgi:UDP-N-acetylglucosamine transferase subunit ALG13
MFGANLIFATTMAELANKLKEQINETEKSKELQRLIKAMIVELQKEHEELVIEFGKRKTARNHEAYCSLNYEGFSDEECRKILKLIKDGKIANVSINYDK